jgi:hypothetical protein
MGWGKRLQVCWLMSEHGRVGIKCGGQERPLYTLSSRPVPHFKGWRHLPRSSMAVVAQMHAGNHAIADDRSRGNCGPNASNCTGCLGIRSKIGVCGDRDRAQLPR